MRVRVLSLVLASTMVLTGCNSQPAATSTASGTTATAAPNATTAAATASSPASSPASSTANSTAAISSAAPAGATDGARYAAWAGRWTGPEGLFVEVTPRNNGQYRLEMQSDLDTRGVYIGNESAAGIVFNRGGTDHVLRASNGDATGLRYLAGKTDCLMVQTSEGYCRD